MFTLAKIVLKKLLHVSYKIKNKVFCNLYNDDIVL